VTGQYSKLNTPEAQLEYLLLFVCRSRSASSRVRATLPNAVSDACPRLESRGRLLSDPSSFSTVMHLPRFGSKSRRQTVLTSK
jgi:hypothetical protein